MANTIPSPNMNLPIPSVSIDPGPDWAQNVNSSFSIIDGHNHSPGSGVLVTPAGLNISSDLSFNANNATNLRTTRFVSQNAPLSGASDLGCLYESGVDLYYNDGSGNQIRITQSGSVTGATGTITGLPSGTASASFSGTTFTFQSATNTPASMAVGPLIIGQAVASGKTVTMTPSVTQAANYDITLPAALPSSTGYIQMDTSGDLTIQGVVVPGTSNGLVSLNGVPGNVTGNPIASGYIGEVVYGPSNRNTGALISFSASNSPQTFQTITLSGGIWLVIANFQIKAGDNSTAFSASAPITFVISPNTNSAGGANGSFACIDTQDLFLENAQNNSGNVGGGTIATSLIPTTTTSYYLNATALYTGTAPLGRGGMMAVRIG